MPLQEEDLEQITVYVREHLDEWVWEKRLGKPLEVYEIELRERTVRVEEELRHQRELMQEGFSRMDRRFEQITRRIDRFMIGSFGITVTAAGSVIAVLKVWP